jgi:predicted RNase H-like HicB family nuclease
MADLSTILERAPRECWLALTEDETKVVGRGETIAEAVEDAKEHGEDDPVVLWSPKEWVSTVY